MLRLPGVSTRARLGAAGLIVVLAASAAWADIEGAVLRMREILGPVLGDISTAVVETRDKLEEVYPPSTTEALHPVFAAVRSLSQEALEVSGEFTFEGDAGRIVEGVFGAGERVGKESWQAVFGAPPSSYRSDIDELMDVTAVLGLNVVTSRVRESRPQHEFWNALYQVTRGGQLDQSAGLAERHMALGMAGIGRVLVEQGETLTSELALLSLRQQEAEYRRRLARGAAIADYAAFAQRGRR